MEKDKSKNKIIAGSTLVLGSNILNSCMENHKDTKDDKKKHTNKLINSASPYLLQHAHNPVNWNEWGEEAWKEAKVKDKLVLVSIGYAACHWCHVMEHESFEDEPTAELMNQILVNIKVDREERPDIDQIYMDACTMMNGSGGWPLNVICLPDGRPLYAGTYFRNKDWNKLLIQLNNLYRKDKAKALKYADNIEKGLKQLDTLKPAAVVNLSDKMFKNAANIMLESFDFEYGGRNHAPKFPTPCVYTYLLDNYLLQGSKQSLEITELTLNKMRLGGLNDLAGGGFTRYSTDKKWFAPHFEKMLYDNGQLMELYVKAYQVTKNKYYLQTAEHIATFLDREMTDEKGGFYSSLDADSEGEEGKFYVWTEDELNKLLGKDAECFNSIHNIKNKGNWEHGNNILHRDELEEKDAKKLKLTEDKLNKLLERSYKKLLKERKNRIRPGTDDKVLTSWNCLAISGLEKLYKASGDKKHLKMALSSLQFIETEMLDKDLNLLRTYRKGKKHISAFLDDYAFLVKAYIDLYESVKEEEYLIKAKDLTAYIITHFYDKDKKIFYYTSNNSEKLISRKVELSDSVIPSSNAVMALNLIKIGYIFGLTDYPLMAQEMLKQVANKLESSVSWYSQWAVAALYIHHGYNQIVVVGKTNEKIAKKLEEIYVPNAIILTGDKNSQLETISKKAKEEKTLIYMCKDFTCGLPYEDVGEFMEGVK